MDTINAYASSAFKATKGFFFQYSLNFLSAILILIAGFLIARGAVWAIKRMVAWVNNTSPNTKPRGIAAFLMHLVYWVIIASFIFLALEHLEFKLINDWLKSAASFTPKLLVTAIIIFIGYIISQVVRTALIEISPSPLSRVAADFAALFILAVSILISIDQIDINIALLNILFIVAFTLLLASLFGILFLASYQIVREMLQARFVSETFIIGQHISVGQIEGTIEAIKKTSVYLTYDAKTIVLPARILLENPVIIINDVMDE